MAYDWKDVRQASLGVIIATLFFFMLRSGDPIHINPTWGLLIGLTWIWLTGSPFLKRSYESKMHFVMNILVATTISTILSLIFNLVTYQELFTYGFFGTTAWLGMLFGIDYAQFFDRYNITNMYDRWYRRKN